VLGRRVQLGAAASLLALVATVAGAASTTGAQRQSPLPGCSARARTLKLTATLRVFEQGRGGRVYSCWRKSRRVTFLIKEGLIEGGSANVGLRLLLINGKEGRLAISGPFVGFVNDTVPEAGGHYDEVVAVNARTGRIAHRVILAPDRLGSKEVATFVMADDGSLAFIRTLYGGGGPCPPLALDKVGAAVIAADAAGTRTLDCGLKEDEPGESGFPGSAPPGQGITMLRLSGRVISWLHAGAMRTTTLG
jgi:hypothetical protein